MSQKTYWLLNNVVSHFAPYHIYGKAGTEVKILHDHLDMMIVQDLEGKVFHSRTDNLSEIPFENLSETTFAEKPIDQKIKKSRTLKKKSPLIQQSNLF